MLSKFILKIIDLGDRWYLAFLFVVVPVYIIFLAVITLLFIGLYPMIIVELTLKKKTKEIRPAMKECWLSYLEIYTNPWCPLKWLTPGRYTEYRSREMLESLLK